MLADEQKKLYPDCWKRKRSLSSATAPTTSQSAVQSPIHLMPPSPSYQHSMPGTPTSLHPLSYHTFSPLSLPPGSQFNQLHIISYIQLVINSIYEFELLILATFLDFGSRIF